MKKKEGERATARAKVGVRERKRETIYMRISRYVCLRNNVAAVRATFTLVGLRPGESTFIDVERNRELESERERKREKEKELGEGTPD